MKNNISNILVTGSNGQLGNELKLLTHDFPFCHVIFVTKEELDITDQQTVDQYFAIHHIDYCVNCAAYTAVDKAESDTEQAFLVNATGTGILANACKKNNAVLIHISTDYVFDGNSAIAHVETDQAHPVSVYGSSKLRGEELALQNCPATIIIRTSWLYSTFNNNFVKTMIRLMAEKDSISVVCDQFGSPTYAADLALAIMQIIQSGKAAEKPGIYNYTNSGTTNWHAFAEAIRDITSSSCRVNAITTAEYPTAARRPHFSVLDTSKIQANFPVKIFPWVESLKKCLDLLQ